jgi:hypothetical protein
VLVVAPGLRPAEQRRPPAALRIELAQLDGELRGERRHHDDRVGRGDEPLVLEAGRRPDPVPQAVEQTVEPADERVLVVAGEQQNGVPIGHHGHSGISREANLFLDVPDGRP